MMNRSKMTRESSYYQIIAPGCTASPIQLKRHIPIGEYNCLSCRKGFENLVFTGMCKGWNHVYVCSCGDPSEICIKMPVHGDQSLEPVLTPPTYFEKTCYFLLPFQGEEIKEDHEEFFQNIRRLYRSDNAAYLLAKFYRDQNLEFGLQEMICDGCGEWSKELVCGIFDSQRSYGFIYFLNGGCCVKQGAENTAFIECSIYCKQCIRHCDANTTSVISATDKTMVCLANARISTELRKGYRENPPSGVKERTLSKMEEERMLCDFPDCHNDTYVLKHKMLTPQCKEIVLTFPVQGALLCRETKDQGLIKYDLCPKHAKFGDPRRLVTLTEDRFQAYPSRMTLKVDDKGDVMILNELDGSVLY